MGYSVYLKCPCCKRAAKLEDAHTEGGCIQVGGCGEAWMSVTYNYHAQFYKTLGGGLAVLSGKTGEETIPVLAAAVQALGSERDTDYWKATDGNAGHILNVMLGWAKQHPTAVWDIH